LGLVILWKKYPITKSSTNITSKYKFKNTKKNILTITNKHAFLQNYIWANFVWYRCRKNVQKLIFLLLTNINIWHML